MEANRNLIFVILAVTLVYSVGVRNKWNKKRCIVVLTIILTCFSGFRSWRMGDMRHYCFAFLECNLPGWELNLSLTQGDTIGLQLFLRAAGQLGLSFENCLFIAAAFIAISVGVLVYRYSPSVYWSYLLYLGLGFYVYTLDILKQAIAMGFIIWAMMAILDRKPLRFAAFMVAATLFHTPALIFVIAYPFANKKVDKYYFLLIGAMVAAVFLFRDQIVSFAGDIYYEEGMEFEADKTLGGKTLLIILFLVMSAVLRPLKRYDVKYSQVFNVVLLAAIVQSFSVYDNIFTRLAEYFHQFIILLIPLALQSSRAQIRRYPDHAGEIRRWDARLIFLLELGITAFAMYFYMSNVVVAGYLDEFCFFWEAEGSSSMELLAEMLAEYGGF